MSEKYAPDQIVFVPRWGGTKDSDWYPWLMKQGDIRYVVAELDKPNAPTIEGCVESIRRAVGDHHPRTAFIGHSVGCQALLQYLITVDQPCWSALMVAGWWDVDEPWETLQPWIDRAPRELPTQPSRGIEVLLSDNDPFTSDHGANAQRWQDFGAKTTIVPGRAHFNVPSSDEVLTALTRLTYIVDRRPAFDRGSVPLRT